MYVIVYIIPYHGYLFSDKGLSVKDVAISTGLGECQNCPEICRFIDVKKNFEHENIGKSVDVFMDGPIPEL